ncbi:MAG: hypothetical protein KGO96_03330 [Elusimicrobia bacterium]|nr:hypothetical protein [Elusimicrobiota bacterium]MDE2236558.1 hypothetical protein [Elusimicrobiota bacterium]MDE2424924.1 hypothetical protein [Elusimicrobiota bacterium]
MDTIKAVFDYTLREHVRSRAWLSAALFGLVLLGAGAIASVLAVNERGRMVLDLGLAAILAIGLVSMVFLTVRLVLQEIESRAVFLILTHPVRRWHYLLGRFFGTLAAVAIGMAGMGLVHWLLLEAFGWAPAGSYALAWVSILGQVALMGALALLLSLALTSEAAAMAFSVFFWVLGHFTPELRYIAERSGSGPLRGLILAFARAAPDFSRLDYAGARHAGTPAAWAAWAVLYVLAYGTACLALSAELFEQKEF